MPDTYPAVGLTPPTRPDKILTVPERSKLEAELKRYSKPTAAAAATKPAPKRKKPIPRPLVPPRRHRPAEARPSLSVLLN